MAPEDEEMITLQCRSDATAGYHNYQFPKGHLARESDYIAGLINSGMRDSSSNTVLLPSLSKAGLAAVHWYITRPSGGAPSLTSNDLDDVMHAATYLQVPGLVAWLQERITEDGDFHNLVLAYELGEKYGATDLLTSAFHELCDKFVNFADSDAFLDLEADFLCKILDSEDVNVPTEAWCVKGLIRWLDHQINVKLENISTEILDDILSKIRYQQFEADRDYIYCIDLVKNIQKQNASDDAIFSRIGRILEEKRKLYNDPLSIHRHSGTGERLRSAVDCMFGTGGFTSAENTTNSIHYLPVTDITSLLPVNDGRDVIIQTPSGDKHTLKGNKVANQRKQSSTEKTNRDSPVETRRMTSCDDVDDVTLLRARTRMPRAVCEHCTAVVDGCLFIVGGQDKYSDVGKYTTDAVYRFNPGNGQWRQMSSMQSPRSLFYLGVLGGRLVAVSGWIKPETVTRTVEMYHPSRDVWEPLSSLPLGLHEHAGCVHEGSIYVSGGFKGPYRGHLDVFYRHTPDTDSWETLAPLRYPRSYHVMTSLSGGVLVLGGVNYIGQESFEDVKPCEFYDITTKQWSVMTSCPHPASCMTSLTVDDRVMIFGGHSFAEERSHNKLQILNTGTWEWTERSLSSKGIQFYVCDIIRVPVKYLTKTAKIISLVNV